MIDTQNTEYAGINKLRIHYKIDDERSTQYETYAFDVNIIEEKEENFDILSLQNSQDEPDEDTFTADTYSFTISSSESWDFSLTEYNYTTVELGDAASFIQFFE